MTSITLYHGTNADGAKSILDSGIIDSGSYYGGIVGVALTPRKNIAEEFAGEGGAVFQVIVPVERLVVDPESYDPDLMGDVADAIDDGASVYALGDGEKFVSVAWLNYDA